MVSCVVTKFIKEARSVFGPQFRLIIYFPDTSEKFLVPVRTVEIFGRGCRVQVPPCNCTLVARSREGMIEKVIDLIVFF